MGCCIMFMGAPLALLLPPPGPWPTRPAELGKAGALLGNWLPYGNDWLACWNWACGGSALCGECADEEKPPNEGCWPLKLW
jgi:hypothetical protein